MRDNHRLVWRPCAWPLLVLGLVARAAPALAEEDAGAPPPSSPSLAVPLTVPLTVPPTVPPTAPAAAAPTAPKASPLPRALAGTSAPPAPTTPTNPSPPPHFDDTPDYFTRRLEPAGFPLLGGTSDIGFEFGGVLTLTKFADGTRPYAWNMDLVLSASVKNLPSGLRIAQQNYLWQLDVPGLAGGRLRLNPEVSYQRTINAGYFGLGNASTAVRPVGSMGTYYQYVHQEGGVRQITRYALVGHVDLMFSTTLRYVNPTPYAGSRLAADASARTANGSPLVTGVEGLGIAGQAAGFVYDSRDGEIFPRRGAFHQLGVKLAQSVNDARVRYGEAGLILANYTPLGGPFVLGTRAIVDLDFGQVPFYELFNGEVFVPDQIPGGSAGIRGVPEGRYLGPIKLVGNVELRAMWGGFHVFGQTFRVGNDLFFDTGRVWSDYTFKSPLDGKGVGLKWGTGAGVYLLWGQAAIFRLEMAYSPDAEAENPGFPFGIYVEDGVMF